MAGEIRVHERRERGGDEVQRGRYREHGLEHGDGGRVRGDGPQHRDAEVVDELVDASVERGDGGDAEERPPLGGGELPPRAVVAREGAGRHLEAGRGHAAAGQRRERPPDDEADGASRERAGGGPDQDGDRVQVRAERVLPVPQGGAEGDALEVEHQLEEGIGGPEPEQLAAPLDGEVDEEGCEEHACR